MFMAGELPQTVTKKPHPPLWRRLRAGPAHGGHRTAEALVHEMDSTVILQEFEARLTARGFAAVHHPERRLHQLRHRAIRGQQGPKPQAVGGDVVAPGALKPQQQQPFAALHSISQIQHQRQPRIAVSPTQQETGSIYQGHG